MLKAKYIGKWIDTSYGQYIVHLEYEYRGRRYEVVENRSKGNIPLAWQHRNEQISIDAEIEREAKQKANASSDNKEFDLDEVYKIMGWD